MTSGTLYRLGYDYTSPCKIGVENMMFFWFLGFDGLLLRLVTC